MYFVSSIKNSKLGITDVNDGVEEFLNLEELTKVINSGVKIFGVNLSKKEITKVNFDMLSEEICLKYVNRRIKEQLEYFNKMTLDNIMKIYCCINSITGEEIDFEEISWMSPSQINEMNLHFYDWGAYYIEIVGKQAKVTCIGVDDDALGTFIREDLDEGKITILDILKCEDEKIVYSTY